jgi:hypothetical protein
VRVSTERYTKDLRSIEVAHRMLALEARTQTIVAWTELSVDRVRTLVRARGVLIKDSATRRQRGPSPSDLSALLSTARMRSEAAAAAGLCRVYDVFPGKATPNARTVLPSLVRAERLLTAFDRFRAMVIPSRLTLEQLVLLVTTVAEGVALGIDHCSRCHATILMDHLSPKARRLCARCNPRASLQENDLAFGPSSEGVVETPATGPQQRLFD